MSLESNLQYSHPAAGVCCLFGPTLYRYRIVVLNPVLHNIQIATRQTASIATVATAKKRLLLPLKSQGFIGEVLPKRRGLRALLRLSFSVDMSSRSRRDANGEALAESSCYCYH